MSNIRKKNSSGEQQSYLRKNKQKNTNQLHSSDSQEQTQKQKYNKQQEESKPSIDFGDNPIQLKCPFCLQNIRTQIILKPQLISILFGFTLFIVLPHVITLILTIIALQITATRKHRCPLCQRQLGSDGKFLVFFKDQVYSFAFGANGIIISKKILSSIGLGILILVILFIKAGNAYADVQWTQLTWPKFVEQCPYQAISQQCQHSNQGLTVKNWKGFVMRVQDNRNSLKRHFQHAVSIYVKMNYQNSLNKNPQKPDLLLTITAYQAHEWQQTLDRLSHGQQIVFNATFQYLRNNRGIPIGKHLNVIDLNRTGVHNNNIHVYMSRDEDLWFFDNLSGQKLRKHSQNQKEVNEIITAQDQNDIKQLYKQSEKQQIANENQQKPNNQRRDASNQEKINKDQQNIVQENQQINI